MRTCLPKLRAAASARTRVSIDRARAANHDFVSALKWGDMHGYDLCINTSGVSVKQIVPEIAAYIRARFEESGR